MRRLVVRSPVHRSPFPVAPRTNWSRADTYRTSRPIEINLIIMDKLNRIVRGGKIMRSVSATDAKQRFAAILDAAQREPVSIRRRNREVAVLLSTEEYQRLRALNIEEFERFCDRIAERAAARGLTEEKLADLLADET
ncbi:MAG: type II toxin-antitoxin system Phd/YefM family antitoxin [Thermoanaerobaculia bacterium]